jgi:hypothetical protein
MNAHLRDAFSDRFDVAGVAERETSNSHENACSRLRVAQLLKLTPVRFGLANLEGHLIVSRKILSANRRLAQIWLDTSARILYISSLVLCQSNFNEPRTLPKATLGSLDRLVGVEPIARVVGQTPAYANRSHRKPHATQALPKCHESYSHEQDDFCHRKRVSRQNESLTDIRRKTADALDSKFLSEKHLHEARANRAQRCSPRSDSTDSPDFFLDSDFPVGKIERLDSARFAPDALAAQTRRTTVPAAFASSGFRSKRPLACSPKRAA